jgi:hypothetical protein
VIEYIPEKQWTLEELIQAQRAMKHWREGRLADVCEWQTEIPSEYVINGRSNRNG